MFYRRAKRKQLRLNFYFKPMSRAERLFIFLLVNFLVLTAALSIIFLQLRPLMQKTACAIVGDRILEEINDVVDQEISDGAFDYSQLVTLEKGDNGDVTALVTNMALMNTLKARLTKGIINAVSSQSMTDLKIPIGNAIGGVIFSGRGPKFTVKIMSVAAVHVDFINNFSAAGINQTRHQILLDVSIGVTLFVPGSAPVDKTVTTQLVVCETVIVGSVPNVYADFSGNGG
ncbi:sporulation protein YunB [Oscillospiraceae bacterium CM]|nr:sporulation protein YunB [Oscillospiraceae bacterium CM]